MSSEINVALQQKFGDAINSGSLEVFEELVAPDAIDHDPAVGQGPGPQGFRDMFREMRSAFPDLHVEVEHLTATGEDVAIAYTLTGTQDGRFMGYEPTGSKISVRGVQIARFDAGMLVERWGSSDQLGILQQLGVIDA